MDTFFEIVLCDKMDIQLLYKSHIIYTYNLCYNKIRLPSEKIKKSFKNFISFFGGKKSNFSAINLYKKYDFKDLGIRNNYYKDGSSAMLMHYYQNL